MVRSAFSCFSWDQCVLWKDTNPDFAEKIRQAIQNFDTKTMAHPGFLGEDVREADLMGYRIECPHKLVPEQALLEKSGLSQKELQKSVVVDEMLDHKGEKIRGVLIPSGDMRIICYRDYNACLSSAHHRADKQARKEQGKDMFDWLKRSLNSDKKVPSCMSKAKCPKSDEELENLVSAAVEAKRMAANQTQVQLDLAPIPDEPVAAQTPEDHGVDEIEYQSGADDDGPALPVFAATAKAKTKAKAKAKVLSRAHKERKISGSGNKNRGCGKAASVLSKSCAGSCPGVPSSVASAGQDGSSGKASGGSGREDDGAGRWLQDLKISDMLAGHSQKLAHRHATKALGGLQKSQNESMKDGGKPGSVVAPTQLLLLKAHLELFRKAEKLLPEHIRKLPASSRLETLRALHLHGHVVPPFTRGSILAQACLETTSIETKILMMLPTSDGDPDSWNYETPVMSGTGLALIEQGKLLQRVLVEDTLLVLLMRGDDGKPGVTAWAKTVYKKFRVVAEDCKDLNTVFTQAVGDLLALSEFFLVLLQDPELEYETTSSAAMIAVTKVNDCKSGIKSIAKQVGSDAP